MDISALAKNNPALEVIEVNRLGRGMFVAELDRPWLGTPFLLQGFMIESDEQIGELRRCCRTVLIDRRRSVGEHHGEVAVRQSAQPRQPGAGMTLPKISVAAGHADSEFLAIARLIRENKPIPASFKNPRGGKDAALEEEMVRSSPIIDDVHRTLRAIENASDSSGNIDLSRVKGLIEEMAGGVERNPDAMLWLTRLKITDQYSYDHAVDVSVHLMILGRFMGFERSAIEHLGQAGLMQDIGKTRIDPRILSKAGPLTEDEYQIVKTHVLSSLELLKAQGGFSAEVVKTVVGHHERHDGSGYPRNLKGDGISLHAELAGLIDTYCAMTRQRTYSSAVSSQRALEALCRMRDTKFRATLVDQLIQCIGLYPIGTLVELNSGEVAIVIQQNQVRRLRPRLLVLLAPDKTLERRPRNLDLLLEPETPTGEPYRIRNALPPDAYGIDPSEFFLDA